MTEVRHPLTGQVVNVDLDRMRQELEAEHGTALGVAKMKATSVVMNYSAMLRRRDTGIEETR